MVDVLGGRGRSGDARRRRPHPVASRGRAVSGHGRSVPNDTAPPRRLRIAAAVTKRLRGFLGPDRGCRGVRRRRAGVLGVSRSRRLRRDRRDAAASHPHRRAGRLQPHRHHGSERRGGSGSRRADGRTRRALRGRGAREPLCRDAGHGAGPEDRARARRDERTRDALPPWIWRRVDEFLRANLASDVSLSTLAAQADLPPFAFARMFRRRAGTTPFGYQRGLRIERARRLPRETELSIAEIAVAVGFRSAEAFAEAFVEMTGVGPAMWRIGARVSARSPG